ncbi:MAG: peptidyl-prolyl cis-trans isomerase, partial [Candidatus Aminicenantes bacterium]|nr:peptidyl-prolyl cis-trans isomerase [Candidatus Aminicenantes bacterium]
TDLFYSTVMQRLQQMSQQYDKIDAQFIQQLNLPQQVLEQMVQRSILLQTAAHLDLKASNEEIRDKIIQYPVFQKDGKFIGFEEYQKVLSWNRISITEFEKNLAEEILIDKTINLLTAGVTVSEDEVWENFKKTTESVRMEYAVLETANIEPDTEPDETQLKTYFDGRKADYNLPERREAVYVFIDTEQLKTEVEVADETIAKYYRDNEAQFKEPEQTRVSRIFLPFNENDRESVQQEAQSLAKRLTDGEDFGIMAEIYSKDDKAAGRGDWGLFEWRSLPQQEQDAINNLAADAVSDPVETEEGIAILHVTEKTPERLSPLETVKDRITTILLDQQARAVADQKAADLEKAAKKEKSLETAAGKRGYTTSRTGLLKSGQELKDIDPSGSVGSAIFNLAENEISSAIYTYKGTAIAQLISIDLPRPAEFDEVREEVAETYALEQKKETARRKMEQMKAELKDGNMEELAEKYGMEYKTVEEHKREQYLGTVGDSSVIDDLAFTLPLNTTSDPVEFESGFTLVRMLERKTVTREEFDEVKGTEMASLLEQKKNKFFQSYLTKLREDLKVRIRYDTFLRVNSEIMSRFTKEEG